MQVGGPPSQPGRVLFRTQDTNNYGVEFSPFRDGLVAIASSQYFGIVGNGRQYVIQTLPTGQAQVVRMFDTNDGIFDCSWNEMNENQLVSACGDGSVKLWDLNSRDNFPIRNYHEHRQEASSVDWNLVSKNMFVTASWDGSIKVWDPMAPQSIRTFMEHTSSVYNAQWSPRHANTFVSCAGDATLKVFDMNQPRAATTIQAHEGEVLAVDWNKYNEFQVASGSTDRTVRVFDLRQPMRPLVVLAGHQFAIRRLKCSPHDENLIGTVSYDMTACFWNTKREDSLILKCEHHTEFVMGIDFNLFHPGQVATCSWDEHVCIFNLANGPPPRIPPIPKRPGQNGPMPPLK